MIKVLIVADTYPFPEYRNGLAKINANLLQPNPHYAAEMLCVADVPLSRQNDFPIHQLTPTPRPSGPGRAMQYLASASPMGMLKVRRYFSEMAEFIVAHHHRFDVIHLSSSHLAGLIDQLPDAVVAKTLLFAIDSVGLFWQRRLAVETQLLKRIVYRHEAARNMRHERRFYPRFRNIVFVSDVDAAFAAAHAPGSTCDSIPNGVDIDYFHVPPPSDTSANSLVFSGDLSYAPNRDAAEFLIDEILPRIPAELTPHLHLVGQRPSARLSALTLPNVSVTGFVDDLRPYIGKAALYVSPLRFGAGIKNKVLEAMSMGRTVVGTAVSFEGIACRDGLDCIVSDSQPDAFALSISKALRERERCAVIGAHARHLIEQRYSWDSVRNSYGKLYADCATHR